LFFFCYHRRFNLVDSKETEVLRDLEIALRLTDDQQDASSTRINSSNNSGGGSSSSSSITIDQTRQPMEAGAQFGCTDCRNPKGKQNSDEEESIKLSQPQSNNA
jgi:hypothetical protein